MAKLFSLFFVLPAYFAGVWWLSRVIGRWRSSAVAEACTMLLGLAAFVLFTTFYLEEVTHNRIHAELVRGAVMPPPTELAAILSTVAYRNGTVVRADPDFHKDMGRVIAGITDYVR